MSKETKYVIETGPVDGEWSFHCQFYQRLKAIKHFRSIDEDGLSKRLVRVRRDVLEEEFARYASLEEAENVIDTLEEAVREARVHANSRAKHILTDALKETGLY